MTALGPWQWEQIALGESAQHVIRTPGGRILGGVYRVGGHWAPSRRRWWVWVGKTMTVVIDQCATLREAKRKAEELAGVASEAAE